MVDFRLRPLSAIRAKCLDCCGWNSAEVRRCSLTDCSLHPYRFGRVKGVCESKPLRTLTFFAKKLKSESFCQDKKLGSEIISQSKKILAPKKGGVGGKK